MAKPNIGENHPSRVRADITVNLNLRQQIKEEWEALKKHDVAFLITVRPIHSVGTNYRLSEPFVPQVCGVCDSHTVVSTVDHCMQYHIYANEAFSRYYKRGRLEFVMVM